MVGDYRGSYSRRSGSSDDSEDSDDASFSVDEETTSSSLYSAPIPTEWTDEKHSLYLKSMEASFVDQLYNSLGALGSNLSKDSVPDIGPSTRFGSIGKPSEEQFKVLRDGFWQKMNVKQPEYRFNGRNGGSHEFLRSPWIKHYKPSPKTQIPVMDEGSSDPESKVVSSNGKKGVVISSSGSASSFKQIIREGCSHSRDRDQISIGEEVSDQNFVNEVTKDENGSSKKMKTVMNNGSSSSTDQGFWEVHLKPIMNLDSGEHEDAKFTRMLLDMLFWAMNTDEPTHFMLISRPSKYMAKWDHVVRVLEASGSDVIFGPSEIQLPFWSHSFDLLCKGSPHGLALPVRDEGPRDPKLLNFKIFMISLSLETSSLRSFHPIPWAYVNEQKLMDVPTKAGMSISYLPEGNKYERVARILADILIFARKNVGE
ncbi:unnamed protein product [Arabis nemorensis]|uniref:Uncharacterized protein n=1 Tax=Arabis nemorensis TaxID=586526 RepID=A0A565C1P9_9BRAS|nr:unnamed protein product [Arabis nemorensis]